MTPSKRHLTSQSNFSLAPPRSRVRIENGGANWLRDGKEVPVGLLDDLKGKVQDLVGGNEEAIKDGIE